MSVIVKRLKSSSMEIYVKGAPEVMADICDKSSCVSALHIFINDISLTSVWLVPQDYEDLLSYYTKRGYRVIAIAGKSVEGLSWLRAQRMKRCVGMEWNYITCWPRRLESKQSLGWSFWVSWYLRTGSNLGQLLPFKPCVPRIWRVGWSQAIILWLPSVWLVNVVSSTKLHTSSLQCLLEVCFFCFVLVERFFLILYLPNRQRYHSYFKTGLAFHGRSFVETGLLQPKTHHTSTLSYDGIRRNQLSRLLPCCHRGHLPLDAKLCPSGNRSTGLCRWVLNAYNGC